MSNYRIKKEKDNIGFKLDPDSMEIDEEMFSGRGNLDNVHIKHQDDYLNDEYSEDIDEITDKDSWKVISAYFNQHGLVSQQIGSFNQFIDKNIQEIIDENKSIIIEPDMSYFLKNTSTHMCYELSFGQAHIAAHPQFLESNSSTEHIIFPNEARVRNLDYLSELSVDINFKEKVFNKEEGTYELLNQHDLAK
jgi:DNA-directed RNA polymerase II subunit RPB2